MKKYHVDAYAAGGQRVASETIEADGSDAALHTMAEQAPKNASRRTLCELGRLLY